MQPNRHGWTLVCCALLLVGVVGLVLPAFPLSMSQWIHDARAYITLVLIIGGSAGAFLSLSPLRDMRVRLPRRSQLAQDDLLDARTSSSRRPEDEVERSEPPSGSRRS